jgi:hypothetical protein
VWVPDFVAGAGGVVYTLAREIEGLTHDEATARVEATGSTVDTALSSPATPLRAATALAHARVRRVPPSGR